MRRHDFILRDAEGRPEEIRLEGDEDSWRLTRSEKTSSVSSVRLPDGRLSLLFADGRQVTGRVRAVNGTVRIETGEGSRAVALADPLQDRLSRSATAGSGPAEEEIRALMPGRVVEVRVGEGDSVRAGDVLLVLEAMKMQNEIRASGSGRVARCTVSAGQAVEGRALLLVLDSSPSL